MSAIIGDFGRTNEGLYLFRINGTKLEIEKAIQDIKDLGCEVYDVPFEFEKAHLHWSVLLKIWLPDDLEKARNIERQKAKESRRKI